MNKVVPGVLVAALTVAMAGCSSGGHGGYKNGGYSSHSANIQRVSHTRAVAHRTVRASHGQHHGHSRSVNGSVVTHTHAGGAGHSHNGLSAAFGARAGRNVAVAGGNVGMGGGNVVVGGGAGANVGGGGSFIVNSAPVRRSSGVSFGGLIGALLIGGLVINALDDDDDKPSGGGTGGGGDVK